MPAPKSKVQTPKAWSAQEEMLEECADDANWKKPKPPKQPEPKEHTDASDSGLGGTTSSSDDESFPVSPGVPILLNPKEELEKVKTGLAAALAVSTSSVPLPSKPSKTSCGKEVRVKLPGALNRSTEEAPGPLGSGGILHIRYHVCI